MAVQVFSVVLGVLLALWIGDWAKERETAGQVAMAVKALRSEIAANRTEVTRVIADVTGKDAEMAKAETAAGPEMPCNAYPSWSGIGSPLLLDAAYQTAIATQVLAHMDFPAAQRIAVVYAKQREFIGYLASLTGFLNQAHPTALSACRHMIGTEEKTNLERLDSAYAEFLAKSSVR